MNKHGYILIATVTAILISNIFCPSANAKLIDLIGAGNFSITAKKQAVTIAGKTVHAMIYEDNHSPLNVTNYTNGIPIPVMRVTAGQMITCRFTNKLSNAEVPEGASIHWHGIELDNDSDGTAVTQDSVKQDQSYTYRFVAPRPGLYWFHSHMIPGDTLWAGMYGILIVQSACEAEMIRTNALPGTNATFTLAMSDIEFLSNSFTNTNGMAFEAGTVGRVGKVNTATPPEFQTINKWIHDCALGRGGSSCRIATDPGNTVLVNGYNPDTTPAPLTMQVQRGQVVRLQLLNEALTRTFYLKLEPTNSQQLIRIGGQGGLLNHARLEGGIQNGGWDTFYDSGAILLSSGMRADVVTTIPNSATNGQRLTLWGEPLLTPGTPWPLMSTILTRYPIAFFDVVAGVPTNNPPPIVNGTPILAGRCDEVISLTNGAANIKTNFMTPPAGFPGTNAGTIRLTRTMAKPSIDDDLSLATNNILDGNLGNGAVWQTGRLGTDRYARVGDLYVLSVKNETGDATQGSATLAHPFHLHGWSMQPLAMIDTNGTHPFTYNEFLDTIEVYGGQTLVFSVRLDDHPRFCDLSSGIPPTSGPVLGPCTGGPAGGAIGRWLYHCHIANHGVVGMMGEIILIEDTPQRTNWVQRPNLTTNGVDVLATATTGSQTVADDFQWTNGPITGVSVWGSWSNDVVDADATFELKFWTDVPAFNAIPSRPGWQTWRQLFRRTYAVNLVASNILYEGFYDPSRTNYAAQGDTKVYRYDFQIPQSQAFSPRPGNTNWLSVTAYTTCPCSLFGWKTSSLTNGWNDDGSWSSTLFGPPWTDLHYPPGHTYHPQSMNMAFQLTVPTNAAAIPAAVSAQPPVLSVTMSDGKTITITWTSEGILQYADEVTGPWYNIDDATSPYEATMDGPRRFYRVRLP